MQWGLVHDNPGNKLTNENHRGRNAPTKQKNRTGLNTATMKVWQARWKAANEYDFQQAKAMTMDQKLEEVSDLLAYARTFPVNEITEREEREVRERWILIKRIYRERKFAP